MNDQQQRPNQEPPPPLDTTRHESEQGINEDDIGLVAAFAKRIGNELYTVDHQNVGSNTNIKALQLDQKKILSGITKSVGGNQSTTAPSQEVKPVQSEVTKTPEPKKSTPRVAATAATNSVPAQPSEIASLEKRLSKVESAINAIRKAKRIKRGTTYNVSSNGFKGEIRDAELLAEFVITEVAKGVKTITIRANDSQNSK